MVRVRRNRLLGATLLAILAPLLAAGPGMPCAGADAEHHRDVGHVADGAHAAAGPAGAAAAEHAGHETPGQEAHRLGHNVAYAHAGDVPIPSGASVPSAVPVSDDAPEPVSPAPCRMGMVCSGTALVPAAVALVTRPPVEAPSDPGAAWPLHASELSLPRRPPRA
ncbi:MAG: hypothetical protein RRA92_06165 [Gemmatimonadota bacterium]|nr:hypothetical protein [Gemmatimonadota bacterium]